MNRKERRMQGIKGKQKVIHITPEYLEKIKTETAQEATQVAFEYMMCIPVMMIHDHYGHLNRKVVDGVTREERFFDYCLDTFDSFNKQFVTLSDMAKVIKEETGFDVAARFKKKKGFDLT